MAYATLADVEVRREIQERLKKLTPNTPAMWGTLNASTMVCHLIDALEIAHGKRGKVQLQAPKWVLKMTGNRFSRWLLIDSKLPWPQGKLKAPPAFTSTKPKGFAQDVARLCSLIDAYARLDQLKFEPSPLLGELKPEQWGRLNARHLRHHLQQFGV